MSVVSSCARLWSRQEGDGSKGLWPAEYLYCKRVARKRKFGEFPVLIRADKNARHEAVARVMNACTANGIWKISFMAIHEHKAK